MNTQNIIEQEIIDNFIHLKYLKFEMENGIYTATLNDLQGYGIVRGYGNTIIEAINDMHCSLIDKNVLVKPKVYTDECFSQDNNI